MGGYEEALKRWANRKLDQRSPNHRFDPDSVTVDFDTHAGDAGTDATPEPYAFVDVRIWASESGKRGRRVVHSPSYDLTSDGLPVLIRELTDESR